MVSKPLENPSVRLGLPPKYKELVLRSLWPLMPGWLDEGRRIVQGPHLRAVLGRAVEGMTHCRRVLNAGSGEGGYSPLLLGLPSIESLLESDFSYRTSAPTRLDPKQLFFAGSLTSVPLTDGTVDLILCTEVLEHIEEHEDALDEIARLLVPGGWLVITVPTPPAPPDAAHVREGYRPEELSVMLSDRGFTIVETRFCMYLFFRWLLVNCHRRRWNPRILIRVLARLDVLLPIGPPMDLIVLARAQQ